MRLTKRVFFCEIATPALGRLAMTEKMGKIIFIIGGVRSGKSKYAIKLAKNTTNEVIFLATGIAKDEEMKKRIEEHKKSRPDRWRTIEETKNISSILLDIQPPCELVIIDCLTFFVSNLLLQGVSEETILQEIKKIVDIVLQVDYTTIVVSNEVGGGVVPGNQLARRFRDIIGLTNQIMAKSAHEVYLIVSGIPVKLKENFDGEVKRNHSGD